MTRIHHGRPATRRAWRRGLSLLTAAAVASGLAVGLAGAPAQAFDPEHTRMQGSAAAMGQTNGPVWTLETVAGRIYAGGAFTSTRASGAAAGSGESGQANLAAFDAASGAPIASFRPRLTNDYNNRPGQVRASVLTPDGSQLIVGGDFNLVDGKRANYLARFDAATGEFLGQVGNNGTDGPVHALAVSPDGSTLYVGGRFARVGYSARKNLGAISLVTRTTMGWAPSVTTPTRNEALRVEALAVSSDNQRVFVGGPFQNVNGAKAQGFAATVATDGSLAPGFRSDYLYAPHSWGTAIEVADNEVFVGSRDDFTSGSQRNEGVYSLNAANGGVNWYARCYGDTFGLQVVGDDVYVASHAHDCSAAGGHPELNPRTYLAVHALNRATGTVRPYFVQTSGNTVDANTRLLSRALASDGNQLVMGGGFLKVNGVDQANLVRFAAGSAAPERPAYPTATAGPGWVDLRVRLGHDRDDTQLTYDVYRGWQSDVPIFSTTRESVSWRTENFTFRDTGVTPGQQVYYRVRATDPSGASTMSVRTATVTVGTP